MSGCRLRGAHMDLNMEFLTSSGISLRIKGILTICCLLTARFKWKTVCVTIPLDWPHSLCEGRLETCPDKGVYSSAWSYSNNRWTHFHTNKWNSTVNLLNLKWWRIWRTVYGLLKSANNKLFWNNYYDGYLTLFIVTKSLLSVLPNNFFLLCFTPFSSVLNVVYTIYSRRSLWLSN